MEKRTDPSAKFEVRNVGSNFLGVKIVNAGTCDVKIVSAVPCAGKVDPAAAGGSDVVIPHAGRRSDLARDGAVPRK